MKCISPTKPMSASEIEAALQQAETLFVNEENAALARVLKGLTRQTLPPDLRSRVLLLSGWLHYRRSEHEAALQCADTVLLETDTSLFAGQAHLLRCVTLEDQMLALPEVDSDKMQPAIYEGRQAIALLAGYPEQVTAYSSIARLLVDWQDLDEGIALLEQVLQATWSADRHLGWAYATLGELYALDKRDWQRGVEHLARAVALLDPLIKTHSWVHSLLAQCYNYLLEPEKAVVHGRRALELAAGDKSSVEWVWLRAHKQYATALTRVNRDLRCAEKHFRLAIRLTEPKSWLMAELYLELGGNLRQQGQLAAAWRAFQQAVAIDQDIAASGAWAALIGEVGFELKKYQDAIAYLQLAMRCEDYPASRFGEDDYRLGVSFFRLGQYREAAQVLRAGLSKTALDDSYRSALIKWLVAANERIGGAA